MTEAVYMRRICPSCNGCNEHERNGVLWSCANCGKLSPDSDELVPQKRESTVLEHQRLVAKSRGNGVSAADIEAAVSAPPVALGEPPGEGELTAEEVVDRVREFKAGHVWVKPRTEAVALVERFAQQAVDAELEEQSALWTQTCETRVQNVSESIGRVRAQQLAERDAEIARLRSAAERAHGFLVVVGDRGVWMPAEREEVMRELADALAATPAPADTIAPLPPHLRIGTPEHVEWIAERLTLLECEHGQLVDDLRTSAPLPTLARIAARNAPSGFGMIVDNRTDAMRMHQRVANIEQWIAARDEREAGAKEDKP